MKPSYHQCYSTHYTLIGWQWFEEIAPRLQAYPVFCPYGVYQELLPLHHGWNGSDFEEKGRQDVDDWLSWQQCG
ncbi:MAG: hypothetical protein AB4062_04090 [Crocosphaera sp.]